MASALVILQAYATPVRATIEVALVGDYVSDRPGLITYYGINGIPRAVCNVFRYSRTYAFDTSIGSRFALF